MNQLFIDALYKRNQDCPNCPSPETVSTWFTALLAVLFPALGKQHFTSQRAFEQHLEKLRFELEEILSKNPTKSHEDPSRVADRFFEALQDIHARLEEDVNALYDGDPAAKSKTEVVRTYPGFFAMAAYRTAHVLHENKVGLIPRMISEYAHSKTGIDIHPAASIGRSFCIDHGTGVVIGETTIIGDQVKIYQGVTLGALSVEKADAETKRHPTIGDRVVIYSGATILGGNTHIGHDSVIGGNVWITRSVSPLSKIYYKPEMSSVVEKESIIFTNLNS